MTALAVAASSPRLRSVIARQTLTDWTLADENGRCAQAGDLTCFSGVAARYYLVSLCDAALESALATPGTLLYWMVRAEIDQIGVLLLRDESGVVAGLVVQREAFLYHSDVPRRRTFVEDLVDHATDMGVRVGAMVVASRFAGPVADASVPDPEVTWRAGFRAEANLVPPELPAAPELWTCSTNHLYGATRILSDYCGVHENLPIAGQIQHGWEAGAGVVLVLQTLKGSRIDRYYVWNAMAIERARSGLVQVEGESIPGADHVFRMIEIGAPYLYLPATPDPGPLHRSGLLAVPSHSIASSRVTTWDGYLSALEQFAAARQFSHVTVLLYWADDTPELRAQVAARGFAAATCGQATELAFLRRVRNFIRQYSAVTADCVSSATMYALYESRDFWLAGHVEHDTPDRFADLVKDYAWIRNQYPGIYAGGLSGRDEALRELGTKRPADELRRVLWHWLY